MDSRLIGYFLLTTVNVILDMACFEDWSLILTATLLWRIGVIAVYYAMKKAGGARPASSLVWRVAFGLPFWGEAYYWLGKMPFTWESDLWSVQSDLVVSIWVIRHGVETNLVNIVSQTTHEMYSSYYTAAGFWKINSHFLNPTTSCATVFLCQHVVHNLSKWLSWDEQVALAQRMAPFAPMGTIMVELSMGLVFGYGRIADISHRRDWTRRGMLLILYFHLAVCLTPPPNNISLFALQCASRLVMMTNPDALNVVAKRFQQYSLGIATLLVLAISYGVQNSFTPLNWSFVAYAPVLLFLHMVLVEEEQMLSMTKPTLETSKPSSLCRPMWTRLATCLALFYSFGTIMLGIMEEASCNMFANLKTHGGSSNHLLLPTGLLFHWFRDAGAAHPYGGGEVRIESTDSNWLQMIYPNDMSHILQPQDMASDLLEAAVGAYRPNFFNAGANRVLGLRERGWIPVPPHGQFLKYSVPSIEWRRMLKEAIDKDGTFRVTYAHLPGSEGDELWRATAWERRVELHVYEGHIVQCQVEFANTTDLVECQDYDLPYHLEDIPWLVKKLGLYHGYPILYNPDGSVRPSIQCFGP